MGHVNMGQFFVLRRLSGNMPELHLDRRLRRMSYTTLKHFVARTPHSGQAADVITEFLTRNSRPETRGCGACHHANGPKPFQAVFSIRELEH